MQKNKLKPVFSHIAAASTNHVIGRENKLPWEIPGDLKFFFDTTRGKALIMGRKTFESLGKPLPGRLTVMVTRNKDYYKKTDVTGYIPVWTGGVCSLQEGGGASPPFENMEAVLKKSLSLAVCSSVRSALDFAAEEKIISRYGREVFIAGGGEIYRQTLPFTDRIYLTRIHKEYKGDAFYPEIPKEFERVSQRDEAKPVPHSFLVYERRRIAPLSA